jgi:hypothetical protein
MVMMTVRRVVLGTSTEEFRGDKKNSERWWKGVLSELQKVRISELQNPKCVCHGFYYNGQKEHTPGGWSPATHRGRDLLLGGTAPAVRPN